MTERAGKEILQERQLIEEVPATESPDSKNKVFFALIPFPNLRSHGNRMRLSEATTFGATRVM